MKLNYGLKEGHKVESSNRDHAYILEIFKAGKNNLGFKHALIQYTNYSSQPNKQYLTALKNITKLKICMNCELKEHNLMYCGFHGIMIGQDDTCAYFK